MPNKDTFTAIRLLQNLSNSLIGKVNIYDKNYLDDLKSRIPKIEKAFFDLKNHFKN